jgi:hypothetical protein
MKPVMETGRGNRGDGNWAIQLFYEPSIEHSDDGGVEGRRRPSFSMTYVIDYEAGMR